MSKKTPIKGQAQDRKYGLFSMLSLIVGVVIGAGIFAKNGSVYGATGSAVMSLVTWGIITVVILLMVFAFIEIASAGKKSGKPGTLSGWITDFINPKLGKWIGIFIMYAYFPGVIAMLPMWGAENIVAETGISGVWQTWGSSVSIGVVILGSLFAVNIISSKTSKGIGQTGMYLKVIPLFTVIIAAIVFMSIGGNNGIEPGFPPNETKGYSMFEGILLAMPAILFTFDGFVFSASMQNEAKSHKTFVTAWVGGMLFVSAIYIAYSATIFTTGGLNLQAAIGNIFSPNVAQWLTPLMSSIVVISMISGLNGQFISGAKSMSALSSEKVVVDTDGKLMKYNHTGRPQYAAYELLVVSLLWLGLFVTMDAINLAVNPGYWVAVIDPITELPAIDPISGEPVLEFKSPYMFNAGDFQTNISTVIAFVGYSIVMIGGIMNRKSNKVDVEKNWYFIPAAVIASSMLIFIAGFQVFDIFRSLGTKPDGWDTIDWQKIVIFVSVIGTTVGVYFYQEKKWKTVDEAVYSENHKIQLEDYLNQKIAPEFQNGAQPLRTK